MASADTTCLTELLELLGHPRRRFVLHYLSHVDRTVETRTLAEAIAAWEGPESDASASAVDSVSVSLHHTHLQSLDASGLVDYDVSGERVELAEPQLEDLSLDAQLQRERDRMLQGVG
jgi:hypothetical protein